MKNRSGAGADHRRMQRQRRRAVAIARAERAADRGGHAAAHRARRHHLRQHHERKHQRDAGERLGAEPADIGGLGHRNQRRCRPWRSHWAARASAASAGSARSTGCWPARMEPRRGACRAEASMVMRRRSIQINRLWLTYYRRAPSQATRACAGVTTAGRIGRLFRRAACG